VVFRDIHSGIPSLSSSKSSDSAIWDVLSLNCRTRFDFWFGRIKINLRRVRWKQRHEGGTSVK